MFTGLVQGVGEVVSAEPRTGAAGGVRFVVRPRWDVPSATASPLELGESISVSGVCLTLAAEPSGAAGARLLAFDVIRETLDRTTLGGLVPGAKVNLERSVRPMDLLGGHVVQGHIDGTGQVVRVDAGEDWRVEIRPGTGPGGERLMEAIVPKGSICVEGVSLTVAGVHARGDHARPSGAGAVAHHAPDTFHVALIPTTLERTTLAALKPGDRVNLETDVMVRTVVHWLRHYAGGGAANPAGGGRGATP